MSLKFDTARRPELLVSGMAGGLVGSEILRIAAEVRALQGSGREVLDLTVGDFAPAQFRIPRGLEERIASALRAGETNYPPSSGMPRLRESVARLLLRELGLEYPLPGVMIAGGARPLIYATYRALVDPGETVVYPVPSWNNNHYSHLVGARSVVVPATPERRFLPDAASLRPHLEGARLLALCSPLNPTGTAFAAEDLAAIADLVLDENRRRGPGARPLYLMYDQVYWMLTFGPVRHVNPVQLRPEMAPWTVIVDGISKALAATGLRVGWGVGPPPVIQRMSDLLGHVGAWAPRAEQVATADFLDDEAGLEEFRREFRAGVERRLGALHGGLQRLAAEGLPVRSIEPMGAIYLTVQFALPGRTNEEIRRLLLERAGVAVVPFQSFAYPGDTGWFRASVGAAGEAEIRRALPRLAVALDESRRRG